LNKPEKRCLFMEKYVAEEVKEMLFNDD